MVATPARIDAWARGARAGDWFAYATRLSLPPKSPGAAHVRLLAARGLVHTAQKIIRRDRPGVPGLRTYLAMRSSKPWPADRPRAAQEPDIVAEVEALAVDRLLPILSRAAQYRRPCPTDRRLAELAACEPALVPAGLAALKALDLIRVERADPPVNRVVTLLDTGWRTGGAA